MCSTFSSDEYAVPRKCMLRIVRGGLYMYSNRHRLNACDRYTRRGKDGRSSRARVCMRQKKSLTCGWFVGVDLRTQRCWRSCNDSSCKDSKQQSDPKPTSRQRTRRCRWAKRKPCLCFFLAHCQDFLFISRPPDPPPLTHTTPAHKCRSTRTRIRTHMHTCTRTKTQTHAHTRTCAYMHTHTNTRTHAHTRH